MLLRLFGFMVWGAPSLVVFGIVGLGVISPHDSLRILEIVCTYDPFGRCRRLWYFVVGNTLVTLLVKSHKGRQTEETFLVKLLPLTAEFSLKPW